MIVAVWDDMADALDALTAAVEAVAWTQPRLWPKANRSNQRDAQIDKMHTTLQEAEPMVEEFVKMPVGEYQRHLLMKGPSGLRATSRRLRLCASASTRRRLRVMASARSTTRS